MYNEACTDEREDRVKSEGKLLEPVRSSSQNVERQYSEPTKESVRVEQVGFQFPPTQLSLSFYR